MLRKIVIGVLVLLCVLMGALVYNKCFRAQDAQTQNAGSPESNAPAQKETLAPQQMNLAQQYGMDSTFILIRKREFKLFAVDARGKILAEYPCALGKNAGQKEKEGDMKTPDGIFVIDEILDASAWTHDFKDGKGEIAGAYGSWFISLDTNSLSKGAWGGIGIHGTHDPSSIGKKASEGCIRLKNEDLAEIKKIVRVGMKVIIEE